MFTYGSSDWEQQGVDLDGEAEDDSFGSNVSINADGTIIAVAAYSHDGNGANSGQAKIYQWSSDAWVLLGTDIVGEASQDFAGPVSLTADGKRLAFGSPQNDGNGSNAGHIRIFDFDEVHPSVTITSTTASPFSTTSFPVTFALSEDNTLFAVEDVTITNGTISDFSGSGTTFTATITPAIDGQVSVDIDENSFDDAAGNGNIASTTLTLDYEDITPPSITVSSNISSPFNDATLPVTFTLSEPSSDFDETAVTITNGTISNFSGSGAEFSANITPIDQGEVSVSVAGATFTDAVGLDNSASNTLTLLWDSVIPEINMTSTASSPLYEASFSVTFTLTENLAGFDETAIAITNGAISDFSGSEDLYTATITPSSTGTVLVEVAENVIVDAAGNYNEASQFSLAYGIPSITSFSPSSGAIGSSVIINGNGFDIVHANNTVYFGDVAGTVTSAGPTQLIVTVPTGATNKPITVLVDEHITTSKQPFNVTFDAPDLNNMAFTDGVDLSLGSYSYVKKAVTGDLDGDGLSDIASIHLFNKTISIFRNTSTGTGSVSFASRVDINLSIYPYTLDLHDMDGDGLLDLIASDESSSYKYVVFRNTSTNGSISFDSEVAFTNTTYISGIGMDDFDMDGKIDVAVSSANKIYLYRNNSTGVGSISFDSPVSINKPETSLSLATGDLDGDGSPEIIAANNYNASISILRNTSSPGVISFGSAQKINTNSSSESVRVADLDNDGLLDIINDSRGLTIFRNTSTGVGNISFTRHDDESYKKIGSIADLDGDGYLNISDVYLDKLSLYHNEASTAGTFNFSDPIQFITSEPINEVNPDASNSYFFDADADGKLDALEMIDHQIV